ncbi:hypothetical protein NDU88_004501 [Pleurodeles waltl]|uniref:Uncharacterized protein n=1 Tax=Pleurodeles waltl TaxID=8319 RepID=A0AAV7NTX1_PLEWA|nr:hypothetical protein NDU88_004501 [Pleurodeles waltl]
MKGRCADNSGLDMKEGADRGTQRVSGCVAVAPRPQPRCGAAGTAPAPSRKPLEQRMQVLKQWIAEIKNKQETRGHQGVQLAQEFEHFYPPPNTAETLTSEVAETYLAKILMECLPPDDAAHFD